MVILSIRYKNKGHTLVYKKGQSRLEVQTELEKRIAKRQKELDKRQWIVNEYNSLLCKQAEDRDWLNWVKKQSDEGWNK